MSEHPQLELAIVWDAKQGENIEKLITYQADKDLFGPSHNFNWS